MSVVWLFLALCTAAWASEGDPEVAAGGHLKAFGLGLAPSEDPSLPDAVQGQGTVDARLKVEASGKHVSAEAHGVLTGVHGSPAMGAGGAVATGVLNTAPELLPLTGTWSDDDLSSTLRFRVDRLNTKLSTRGLDLTAGRQPLSFGQGKLFTPLDLVAPFTPATLDTAYKPGVDAVRADTYAGVSGVVTGVVAYVDSDDPLGLGYAAEGRTTVGVTDLGAFFAYLYGDPVVGLSVYAPVGQVGLYADTSVTATAGGAWHARGVAGLDLRPTNTTTVTAEVYGQTFGADQPSAYGLQFTKPRYTRGELWLLAHLYAGAVVSQELSPLVRADVFALSNLNDGSVLVSASVDASVREDANLSLGVLAGLGQRPDAGTLRSEFGAMPPVGFLSAAFYL